MHVCWTEENVCGCTGRVCARSDVRAVRARRDAAVFLLGSVGEPTAAKLFVHAWLEPAGVRKGENTASGRLDIGSGRCRVPCGEDGGCRDDAYCAVSSVCRESGACVLDADCLRPGNDFPAPLCEGWPACGGDGQCEWYCGDPRCTDLLGVDFGPCEQVLGVARVNGVCMVISGCEAEGYPLFDDMEACIRGCR